ncbi:MAG TPA: hypothetical protein PLE12_12590, partial [Propionicimonas sp.]|nr:hypothetical protein [Propionicimonas sp.]
MDLALVAQVLNRRAALARSERLRPDQIAERRARQVRGLREFALSRSSFYTRFHEGLERAPLADLPILTKADLMAHFDQVVTDPRVTRSALTAHLARLAEEGGDPGRAWRGRWWAAATAGSTGEPAVLAWNRGEWATVLASYARAMRWADVPLGPTHPLRLAIVSSLVPSHQSAVVGATSRAPFVETLRLDARTPLADLADSLNHFQPRVLVGYASALRALATAQLDGRLDITPQTVMSASEVLSSATADVLTAAWGRLPFDVYAATETAGIASTCSVGARHLYDDLLIVEPVDADDRPVPPGTPSARTLVTVLFNRTVPLIRYALSDRVTPVAEPCTCGLPFARIGPVGGRAEDTLAGVGGLAGFDPEVLRPVIEAFPVARWQVGAHDDALEVLLVVERPFDTSRMVDRLNRVLPPGAGRHSHVGHTWRRVR